MPQVIIIQDQLPAPTGPTYTYNLDTTELRDKFITDNGAGIWWYYFPEDDAWVKGPAWDPPEEDKVVTDNLIENEEEDRW